MNEEKKTRYNGIFEESKERRARKKKGAQPTFIIIIHGKRFIYMKKSTDNK